MKTKTKKLFSILLAALLLVSLLPTAFAERPPVEINETNFPDPNFRNIIKDRFDSSRNGYLEENEIADADFLNIYSNELVKDYAGIEYLSALKYLSIDGGKKDENNAISLDLSNAAALEELFIQHYVFADKLDLNGNPKLRTLSFYGCEIDEIDLTGCPALEDIYLSSTTGLKALDLSGNKKLRTLSIHISDIEALDLSGLTELIWLNVMYAPVFELDISDCPHLIDLIESTDPDRFDDHTGLWFYEWRIEPEDHDEGEILSLCVSESLELINNRVMVYYAPGEGSGEMDPTPVIKGQTFELPECGFIAPNGKRFTAWGCDFSNDTFNPKDTLPVEVSVTFTALWEDIPSEEPTEEPTEPNDKPTPDPKPNPSSGKWSLCDCFKGIFAKITAFFADLFASLFSFPGC